MAVTAVLTTAATLLFNTEMSVSGEITINPFTSDELGQHLHDHEPGAWRASLSNTNLCEEYCNTCPTRLDYHDTDWNAWGNIGSQHRRSCRTCGRVGTAAAHTWSSLNTTQHRCSTCYATDSHSSWSAWAHNSSQHWQSCGICGYENRASHYAYTAHAWIDSGVIRGHNWWCACTVRPGGGLLRISGNYRCVFNIAGPGGVCVGATYSAEPSDGNTPYSPGNTQPGRACGGRWER